MTKPTVSIDEFLSARKTFARDGLVLKAFKAPPSFDAEARTARFIMSTQQADRDGDVIVTEGIDTSEFEKNPVALLMHNARNWPIGQWSDLEKKTASQPPRLEGVLNFMPEGDSEEADMAALFVQRGVMRACSIGFLPKEVEMIRDDEDRWTGGFRIPACEIVECSLVPIPANPGALVKEAGGCPRMARELIEQVLDEWVKLPDGLVVPREAYEAKRAEITDSKTISLPAAFAAERPEAAPGLNADETGLLAKLARFLGLRASEANAPGETVPETQADCAAASAAMARAKALRLKAGALQII
jgi:HK97 family phage prohead protease